MTNHAAVPAEHLYLAVLDAPVSRGRARTEELSYALEACLPVEPAGVHPVYRDLPDGRVLAVAISREHGVALGRVHTTAAPAEWPCWLAERAVAIRPDSVNLLTGPLTPPAVKRARSSTLTHALTALMVLAAVAAAGLERRVRAAEADAGRFRVAAAEMYRDTLGAAAARSSQPPAALLTAELRTLRATRLANSQGTTADTAADRTLAALLAAWPTDAVAKTESVTVAERGVEVVLRVPDLAAAQTFVTALGRAEGLSPGPVGTDQSQGEVRATLRFDREAAP